MHVQADASYVVPFRNFGVETSGFRVPDLEFPNSCRVKTRLWEASVMVERADSEPANIFARAFLQSVS